MENVFSALSLRKCLIWVYLGTLLLSFHSYFTAYVNSSFLEGFFGSVSVGVIYVVSAVISLVTLVLLPREIRLYGKFRTILLLSVLQFGAVLALAYVSSPILALLAFLISQITLPLIFYVLDIYVEDNTYSESLTGIIRGLLLTAGNLALVLSPYLVGVLAEDNIQNVFLFASLFILPFLLLTLTKLRVPKKHISRIPDMRKAIAVTFKDRNLRNVFLANLILQIFYAGMVIWSPIYLTKVLEIPWSTVGLLFTFMLLPFLMFELPVGFIADKYAGEKEMMIVGFGTISIFTAAFGLVPGSSIFLLGAVLFLTRTGAVFAEMTTESYFFKKVSGRDPDLISVFRSTRPLAFIIGPPIGIAALSFMPYQGLFLTLGALTLLGALFASRLKDTL
ncbi:MAG: MFS transporter [Patescibacteria group bacterium]